MELPIETLGTGTGISWQSRPWFPYRFGIHEELANSLALALGSSAASPMSMATAYATLARGGKYIPPQVIRRVEDEAGRTLIESHPPQTQSLDLESTKKLVSILIKVVKAGTGTRARIAGIPVAGKTGTADEAKDLWFVGFTPDISTAVWCGNSQNKPVHGKNITGGTVAAVMWKRYTQAYYKNHPRPKGGLVVDSDAELEPLRASEAIKIDNRPAQSRASSPSPSRASRHSTRRSSRRSSRPSRKPGQATGSGITEYRW